MSLAGVLPTISLMRVRFTTPHGITAVLAKAGELYELDVDLPDRPTDKQHQELEQLLRFGLAAVELAETEGEGALRQALSINAPLGAPEASEIRRMLAAAAAEGPANDGR